MKKRTKLISAILLSLIFVISSIAFVGCSKKDGEDLTTVDAKLVEGLFKEGVKTSFVVESVIDIEDYIVKQDGAKRYAVHFNYTDDNGTSKTDVVKGLTYYLMNKGTYQMVYTVELEKEYVRQSLDIEVIGKGISITTNKYPLVYKLGEEPKLKAVMNKANPYCSATNEFKFEKVDYYETAFDLEKTVNEQSKFSKSLDGETKIKFDKAGIYEFTISCSVEGESATSIVKVVVIDENKKGNAEFVKKNGESYWSENAEIEGDIVKLTQADYDSASYLVLDGTYYDEDVIRVDFKGQNCPQIGLLTQPIEDAYNPYALYGGKGFTFSLEYSYKNMFSIWGDKVATGLGRFSGSNMHNGNKSTGYFGLENLNKDAYYTLELNLSTTSAPDSINVFRLAILEIVNYGTAQQSYKKVYPTEKQAQNYIEVPAGTSKDYESGEIIFYGSRYDDITFKLYKPMGRVDLESFELSGNTVTWDALDGATNYYVSTDGSKYTKCNQREYTFTEFYQNKTPLWVIAEKSDCIALDKATNGSKKYYNAAIYNNILPEETVPYTDTAGEFIFADTKDSKLTKSPDTTKTHTNVTLLKKGQEVLNYVKTKTEYDPGTYAVMAFKGSNFPGVILFGAKDATMSTEHDKTQGIGFYLDTNSGGRTYVNTTSGGTATIGNFSAKSYLDRGYLNAGHAAYFGEDVIAGNKIRNFVVALGVENVTDGVELNYVLFREKYTGGLELVQDMNFFIAGETLQKGCITVCSTRHQQGTTFTYKWYEPQANLESALNLIENQYGTKYERSPLNASDIETSGTVGVSTSANGTFNTTADDYYNVDLSFASVKSMYYAKTKQTYAQGTYIMTEFVGKEMIPTIFFGVNDIGNTTVETNLDYASFGLTGVGIYAGAVTGSTRYVYRASKDGAPTVNNGYKYLYNSGYLKSENTGHYGTAALDADDKTYVFIIGASSVTGGVNIEYILFEKNTTTGGLTLVEGKTQLLSGAVLNEGNILFGSATNVQVYSKFKLYQPDTRANIISLLADVYGMEYRDPVLKSSDFSLSVNNATVTVNQNNTYDNVKDDYYSIKLPSTFAKKLYYAKTNNTYESGTYVLAEFVGANMIPTIFFGVTDIGSMEIATDNDYLNIGLTGVGIFAGVQNAGTKYVYRATSTETATVSSSVKLLYNYGYLVTKNTAYGDASLTACDKTYVLLIGANSVTGGVNVDYSLFEKNTTTGSLTLVEEKTQLLSGAVLNEGNILFGSATNVANTANFKLYAPDTKANLTTLMGTLYTMPNA